MPRHYSWWRCHDNMAARHPMPWHYSWRRRRRTMQSYINLSLAPHPPTSRTHPSTLTHASSWQFLAPIGEMDPTTPTSCESTTDSCSSTSTCGSQVSRYAHTKSQVSFTYWVHPNLLFYHCDIVVFLFYLLYWKKCVEYLSIKKCYGLFCSFGLCLKKYFLVKFNF